MRTVVAGLFMSLDGVVEAPNKWQFDHFDADMAAALTAHMAAEDTVLLGRVTYQEWAPYWPTSQDEPYASHINNTPKFVLSTTLKRVDWNSTLVQGPLRQAITELKNNPGKNIGVAGSPTLVRSLLQGKRLFREGDALKRLKLATAKATGTGVLIATDHRR